MASELLLPTHGVSFVLGIAACVVGVTMLFSVSVGQALLTLVALCVLVPILGPVLLHFWPQTPIGKRLILEGQDEDATVASMPVNLELEQLRGRYGKTLSALRPSGLVEFDGRRVDVVSEGMMIEPGQWVRCIEVRAGRVVVRQVDQPPDLADLDAEDLRR